MEKVLIYLNLVAWLAAILASLAVIMRIYHQGRLTMRGDRRNVPVKWPAVIAAAAWLWIIAGCLQ